MLEKHALPLCDAIGRWITSSDSHDTACIVTTDSKGFSDLMQKGVVIQIVGFGPE
jgi:hypothetical protein